MLCFSVPRCLWGFVLLGVCCSGALNAGEVLPKIRVAPDGRTFVIENGKPFVPLGVTYYRPGTGWAPQVWKKFDAEATGRDFAQMKEVGVNCVRVFLSYGSFCTEPDALLPEGLANRPVPGHRRGCGDLRSPHRAGSLGRHSGLGGRRPYRRRTQSRRSGKFLEGVRPALSGRTVLFAYDLRNEPEVQWDTPALRTRWNAWLQTHYGTAEKAAQAWGLAPADLRWGRQPPLPAATLSATVNFWTINTSARAWPSNGPGARPQPSRRPIPRPWSPWV